MRIDKCESPNLWQTYHFGTYNTVNDLYAPPRPYTPHHLGKEYWATARSPVAGGELTETPLGQIFSSRRSCRCFSARPVDWALLESILTAAYGPTGSSGHLTLLASPSAGARYPIEIYPLARNVIGTDPGLHHYDHLSQTMELLVRGDLTVALADGQLGPNKDLVESAAVTLILTAVFVRTTEKYGDRGYRYILLDAGHLGQNLWLAAAAAGLGCVTIGGFRDEMLNRLVGVDARHEACIYLVCLGWPGDGTPAGNPDCTP